MMRLAPDVVHPRKACPGDRVAVLSPSFAAAGAFPAVHEQAMRRLTEVTGLVPVEFPTTRQVGASAPAGAADVNAAFAEPEIRGILAVVGGEDQITVLLMEVDFRVHVLSSDIERTHNLPTPQTAITGVSRRILAVRKSQHDNAGALR